MNRKGEYVRFEILEVEAVDIIDLGPIIDTPFVDGIIREAPDAAISARSPREFLQAARLRHFRRRLPVFTSRSRVRGVKANAECSVRRIGPTTDVAVVESAEIPRREVVLGGVSDSAPKEVTCA